MINRFLLLAILFIFSCKPDTAVNDARISPSTNSNTPQEEVDFSSTNTVVVPNACSLVPKEIVAKAINIDPELLEVKQGNPTSEKNFQACFFKWDSHYVNSGILFQVSRNPVYDEFKDWAVGFITSKRTDGEVIAGGQATLFQEFPEFGDDGSYSYEAGKYYWRIGMDYVVMIAFNMDYSQAEQYKIAKVLGAEIMKKF